LDQSQRELTAHISGLRRYAMALARNESDAEDLVQECLCRAIERVRPWREIKDIRAYLFSILHNLYIDRIVKNRHRALALPDQFVEQRLSAPPTQQETVELRELSRALDQLAPEQRQLILLVGLEGISYEATAKILDLPIGTVMSRLFRARETLRKMTGRVGTAKRGKEKLERVNGRSIGYPAEQHGPAPELRVRR
jgi:RNA polymerase sigma-70 factor, ECF subfamily